MANDEILVTNQQTENLTMIEKEKKRKKKKTNNNKMNTIGYMKKVH